MAALCLTLYDFQTHVPSDIEVQNQSLPATSFKSKEYLDNPSDWTKKQQMKLNPDKSNYMIVKFANAYQFSTRLKSDHIVKNAYKNDDTPQPLPLQPTSL